MATDALTCADVKDMLLKESKNVTEVAPSSMTRFKPSSDLALRAQPRLIVAAIVTGKQIGRAHV